MGGMHFRGQVSILKPRALPSPQAAFSPAELDTVRFEGAKQRRENALLKQYGITLNKVRTDLPAGIILSDAEKRRLVLQALETYEHAAKKRLLNERLIQTLPGVSHISGRNFSSTVELANGLTALAVNSEFTRDDVLCGERSGIVSALNQAIGKVKLGSLENDPAALDKVRNGMKVKRLVMSGAHRGGTDNLSSPAPCSDCQAWLATSEYFSPDTQIVTLERKGDAKTPEFTLKIQTVKQLLPFWGKTGVSLLKPAGTPTRPEDPQSALETMPMVISKQAQGLLIGPLGEMRIRELLGEAQKAYQQNNLAEVSEKNGAVSALFMPINEIKTASRFDITARWYNDPAKSVLEEGFRDLEKRGISTDPTKGAQAVAFAFYGNYPQPTVNTLGYLAQLERGDGADKTLIVLIEDNSIQVRTIRDFMPDVYMSARVPREGKKL